jgi:hypothetical protein
LTSPRYVAHAALSALLARPILMPNGCGLVACRPAYRCGAGAAFSERQDFEGRVLVDDRVDLRVAGVWSDAVEEHSELDLPRVK